MTARNKSITRIHGTGVLLSGQCMEHISFGLAADGLRCTAPGPSGAYNAAASTIFRNCEFRRCRGENVTLRTSEVSAETSFKSLSFEGPKSCMDLLHIRSGGGKPVQIAEFSYLSPCLSNEKLKSQGQAKKRNGS